MLIERPRGLAAGYARPPAWAPLPERDRSTVAGTRTCRQGSMNAPKSSIQVLLSKSTARNQHVSSGSGGHPMVAAPFGGIDRTAAGTGRHSHILRQLAELVGRCIVHRWIRLARCSSAHADALPEIEGAAPPRGLSALGSCGLLTRGHWQADSAEHGSQ
jgi:hypothetical protein